MKWKPSVRIPARVLLALVVLVALATPVGSALADGTETLGDPSIAIESGSGHVAAGTGLFNQPGSIDITVPSDSTVEQVLLYWEGHGDCGDVGGPASCQLGNEITVDGNVIDGTLIGGPTFFYTLSTGQFFSLSYRADITDLNLVSPGANTLSISDLSFDTPNVDGFANGASVIVIFDDGSEADIGVKDGNDNAFISFAPTLDTTVPQTFDFAAEDSDRTADLTLLAGSVKSPEFTSDGPRPNRIVVTINGVEQNFDNELGSNDGPTWDTITLPISIPAGASSMTVQILSFDDGSGDTPASLSWVGATLSVPITPDDGEVVGTGTPGYWQNHPDAWPVDEITIGGETYSKNDAIKLLKTPGRGDKSYDMFAHLVSAKLNVLNGAESSCIDDTIDAADQWLIDHPLGSNVRGSSDAWDVGEPLKNELDDYNNGRLCAPSRDSLE